MAVDSRDKGKRAEYQVRDILRDFSKLEWERVPGSGAFGQSHGLKGDIYLPPQTGKISAYTFEVKHYKDDNISSNLFNTTESTLEKWWDQCTREAEQMNNKPALVFKKDRGKWLIALDSGDYLVENLLVDTYIIFRKNDKEFVIGLFENWLHTLQVEDLLK